LDGRIGQSARRFTPSLVDRGAILGALAVFSREELSQQEFLRLRIFADQVAVAISNARAFEKILRAEAALRAHAQELQQLIDMVPQHMYILQTDGSSAF